MYNASIILQIQATYNQLTKAEKKVADYVLQNKMDVLYMSITDLADACEVGDTSVYRFCRALELQGYQEFKMKLSLSLSDTEETRDSSGKGGDEKTLAYRIMEMHMNAIQESYKLVNYNTLDTIIRMMEDAKRIIFLGIGDSLLTAKAARNKFLRITGKAICISDPHIQSMVASTATKDDLTVIISYSGATKDTIHVANEAKKAGARIVAITHFRKSPLTAYSDAVLLCGAEESPLEGGSMTAKIGQLYLIDLLFQEYYSRNYKECLENNKKTSAAVVEKLF